MAEIRLTKGYVAIVDDEDLEIATKFKWYASYNKRSPKPYAAARVLRDGKNYRPKLHRLIMGEPKGMVVDHINGNTLDNRRENLRVCTPKQNAYNSDLSKCNSTGLKGVTYRSRTKNYSAQIMHERKYIHLGMFKTAELAAKAYDVAAKKYFGEFAKTNFEVGAYCRKTCALEWVV